MHGMQVETGPKGVLINGLLYQKDDKTLWGDSPNLSIWATAGKMVLEVVATRFQSYCGQKQTKFFLEMQHAFTLNNSL